MQSTTPVQRARHRLNDVFAAELCTLFTFERDLAERLACVPMAVRFKLDVAGVKISLKDWVRLVPAERQELLGLRFDGPREVDEFRARITVLVRERTGTAPPPMPLDDPPSWETGGQVPAPVQSKAAEVGVSISDQAWSGLSPLRRFALVKLSRARHDNANFLPALREFGLV